MKRTICVAKKVIKQIIRDKRTLAIIMIVPMFLFTLIYFVLQGLDVDNIVYDVGIVDVKLQLNDTDNIDFKTKHYSNFEKAKEALKHDDLDVIVTKDKKNGLEFVFRNKNKQNQQLINLITTNITKQKNKVNISSIKQIESKQKVIYNYELNLFDKYSAPLMGIMIFFLVFLTSGIKFLNERLSGTLNRILVTPIKKIELILGYNIGFAILAIIQTIIITLFCKSVLGVHIEGGLLEVLTVNILIAICAVSLAMLLSSLASSQFEFVQLIPIVIIPQIFLCGLFELNKFFNIFSHAIPLYYSTNALNNIILYGCHFKDISKDILCLICFVCFNIFCNLIALCKYRKK